MKYKMIAGICVCMLSGSLCCVAVISQAKTADGDAAVTQTAGDRNENITETGSPEQNVETENTGSDGVPASENMTGLSAGIQTYLDSLGTGTLSVTGQLRWVIDEAEIPPVEEPQQDEAAQEESEYADLAIANVNRYVNVRQEPNTDSKIIGKIYDGAVAQILALAGENDDWFQMVSGNVEGYIKAEYFLYGDAAVAVIDDYVTRYATVQVDRLNVRKEPDINASRVGYVDRGEKVKILENQGEWLKVQYTDSATGYVAAQYVTVSEEFVYAKTLEEEAKEIAERKALEERQKVSETQAVENTTITVTPPAATYTTNAELRQEIVDYAMQFLGNKYVHGGRSLSSGTDCSGFTSLIYAEFGYSLSRTPAGQLSNAGRSIDYSEIQPGDVICYGSKGKCTHVGLYIGDGQIIHSANSRKGVIISNAGYDTILGVKNIID